MAIRITSRIGGFRRAGVEHPATPAVYSDDRFTPAQLAALKAEPMLIVDEITDAPIGDGGDPSNTGGNGDGSDTLGGSGSDTLGGAGNDTLGGTGGDLLAEKTIAELKAYAADPAMNAAKIAIDLGKATKKADILAVIHAAEAAKAAASDADKADTGGGEEGAGAGTGE